MDGRDKPGHDNMDGARRARAGVGTLVLTREGERLLLEIEPSRVNTRIQYTGHFEGKAKTKGMPAALPSQVVPDGRYAVACLRGISDLRGRQRTPSKILLNFV